MDGEHADSLRERLQGARLAPRWSIELSVFEQNVYLRGSRDGTPLERLADALFRQAIEAALARYVRWLGILARRPETFPEEQIEGPEVVE